MMWFPLLQAQLIGEEPDLACADNFHHVFRGNHSFMTKSEILYACGIDSSMAND